MAGADWCHFAVRLDRSRAHRQSKHAALGWEDEKFAYVVAVRDAALLRARAEARVIRRPRKETGHVRLALCAAGGLTDAVVTAPGRRTTAPRVMRRGATHGRRVDGADGRARSIDRVIRVATTYNARHD